MKKFFITLLASAMVGCCACSCGCNNTVKDNTDEAVVENVDSVVVDALEAADSLTVVDATE